MSEDEIVDQLCLIAAAIIEDVHDLAVLHGDAIDRSGRLTRLADAGANITTLMRAAIVLNERCQAIEA